MTSRDRDIPPWKWNIPHRSEFTLAIKNSRMGTSPVGRVEEGARKKRRAGSLWSLCSHRPQARRLALSQARQRSVVGRSWARRRSWQVAARASEVGGRMRKLHGQHPDKIRPWHRCAAVRVSAALGTGMLHAGKRRPEQPCASGWGKKKEREKRERMTGGPH